MTIKLVRTDAVDPCKIKLPLGEHVFGRGKLLECDDKRISRLHGKLENSDDSLTITALHQNPCFFIKKGLKNTEILRQNNTVTLCNGDRFGLLPDAFWYEVIFCCGDEAPNNEDTEKNTEEYCVGNNDCNSTAVETNCDQTKISSVQNSDDGFDNIAELQTSKGTENNDSAQELCKDPEPTNTIQNVSEQTNKPNEIDKEDELNIQSQSILPNEPNVQSEANIESETNMQGAPNVQNVSNVPSNTEDENNESNSSKRSHSPDNSDVKKIKTEPAEVKTENSEDAKPGPSLNQAANDGACANAPNNQPLRERCMYGANCYRKNPQHLSQFAHPRDADWGAGERGACPYGAACAKRDPRHWRDHDHPPGKLPPPRPGQKKRHRRDSSDSSDSPTQNLVVSGKRARKAVPRQAWAGDSDEEPDPYATDESDEWKPSSAPSQEYSEDYL